MFNTFETAANRIVPHAGKATRLLVKRETSADGRAMHLEINLAFADPHVHEKISEALKEVFE